MTIIMVAMKLLFWSDPFLSFKSEARMVWGFACVCARDESFCSCLTFYLTIEMIKTTIVAPFLLGVGILLKKIAYFAHR